MNETLILVIDGDPEGLDGTRASLESFGFLVLAAAGPIEAQRCLETFKPHAILCEIRASDPAGLDLARDLKTQPETRTIPVIGLGSPPVSPNGAGASEDACDVWLTRPFDAARLRQAITDGAAGAFRQ